MLVQFDTEVGATYLQVSEAEVARTVHLRDLVMVDVDTQDKPVGVEFAVAPEKVTDLMVEAVAKRFPELEWELVHDRSWMHAGSCTA